MKYKAWFEVLSIVSAVDFAAVSDMVPSISRSITAFFGAMCAFAAIDALHRWHKQEK